MVGAGAAGGDPLLHRQGRLPLGQLPLAAGEPGLPLGEHDLGLLLERRLLPLQAIFRILVPQIRPGIITAVIFVFIPILGEYLTPQIVGGTGGVMIGNLIVNFFQAAEYTRGAAVSLLIALFILLVLVVFRRSLSAPEAYGA